MNTVRSLTFLTSPTTVVVSVLVVLATAAVSFWAWRRGGYRRAHGLQELLRVGIVALVAVLFNQPEWVEEFRPDEQPTVAILWDQSDSMQTQDALRVASEPSHDDAVPNELAEPASAPRADSRPKAAVTREAAIAPLTDPAV
ncbi:MAG: hypothetical protein KDA75_01635 [Planctomycetaceae bacterium]|nr:hypothetical protein [Planctomycetaceae bacterium]